MMRILFLLAALLLSPEIEAASGSGWGPFMHRGPPIGIGSSAAGTVVTVLLFPVFLIFSWLGWWTLPAAFVAALAWHRVGKPFAEKVNARSVASEKARRAQPPKQSRGVPRSLYAQRRASPTDGPRRT